MFRKYVPYRFFRKRTNKIILGILGLIAFWTFFGFPLTTKDEDFPTDVDYDVFIDETRNDHIHVPLDDEIRKEIKRLEQKANSKLQNPADPIILWWTEFTKDPGTTRTCGKRRCFFTNNREYMSHDNTKVFMFYGTDFNANDLPLPREDNHDWALLHEESPKNNYLLMHEDVIQLFNFTSTFSRHSDFPLTTQHLNSMNWLRQKTYLKSVGQKDLYQKEQGLAPVAYVQSDCDPPSDRDSFVKQLMKYVRVDSYGKCLNNKKLPESINKPIEGMAHEDFYELLSHYKFVLSMENAVCEDYVTEKLWRPLMVGAVPIVFGSTSVRDLLPDNNSALLINDFDSAQQLAQRIRSLNQNDEEYEKLLNWKHERVSNDYLHDIMEAREWRPDDLEHWDPNHVNFVEGFECFVCNQIHENMEREVEGEKILHKWANQKHLGCPKRQKFDDKGKYRKDAGWTDYWKGEWERQKDVAKYLLECVQNKLESCHDFIHNKFKKRDF